MTNEEAIDFGEMWLDMNEDAKDSQTYAFFKRALEALKAEPCEDAASQKIDEFELKGKTAEIWIVKGKLQIRCLGIIHNIPLPPVIPKPTECEDAVSREAVMQTLYDYGCESEIQDAISKLPLVTPKKRTGK